ncbi:MAG: hypothetical protein LBM13_06015 [Candidatus Ancillula sp.]|nr:hypothetical protein [Candidatus Ancillula sp.]
MKTKMMCGISLRRFVAIFGILAMCSYAMFVTIHLTVPKKAKAVVANSEYSSVERTYKRADPRKELIYPQFEKISNDGTTSLNLSALGKSDREIKNKETAMKRSRSFDPDDQALIDMLEKHVTGYGYDYVGYGLDFQEDGMVVKYSGSNDQYADNGLEHYGSIIDLASPCIEIKGRQTSANSVSLKSSTDIESQSSSLNMSFAFGLGGEYDVTDAKTPNEGKDIQRDKDGKIYTVPFTAENSNGSDLNDVNHGAGGSIKQGFSLDNVNSSTNAYFNARLRSVTYIITAVISDGEPATDDTGKNVCEKYNADEHPANMSEKEWEKKLLWNNLSTNFKNDVLRQVDPKALMDKWGQYVVTSPYFGAVDEVSMKYSANKTTKEWTTNTGAQLAYKAFTTNDTANASETLQKFGDIMDVNEVGRGALGTAGLNLDTSSQASGQGNADKIRNWTQSVATNQLSKSAFIGWGSTDILSDAARAEDSSANSNLKTQRKTAIDRLGHFLWNLIPSDVDEPMDLDQATKIGCVDKNKIDEDGNITPLYYSDCIHTVFNTMLAENGSRVSEALEIPQGPYVKQIYAATASNQEDANANLRKKMGDRTECALAGSKNCGTERTENNNHFVLLGAGDEASDLNDGAGAGSDYIALGYTLTNDPNKALSSFRGCFIGAGDDTCTNDDEDDDSYKLLKQDMNSGTGLSNWVFLENAYRYELKDEDIMNALKYADVLGLGDSNTTKKVGSCHHTSNSFDNNDIKLPSEEGSAQYKDEQNNGLKCLPMTAVGLYNKDKEKMFPDQSDEGASGLSFKVSSAGSNYELFRGSDRWQEEPRSQNMNQYTAAGSKDLYIWQAW